VIVAGRDLADKMDVYRCLNASDGKQRWAVRQVTEGNLDYGNSPRATPLIVNDLVYLFGAFGHLHCVQLASGKTVWQKELPAEFDAHEKLPWGYCSSPLAVDGKLIINPGGPKASIVALALRTGETLWKTPGGPPGYGSLIVGDFGSRRQIVGHDATSLGGWDVASGQRLWKFTPLKKGDFNVPTPLAYKGQLVISTERNGTRLFRFSADGKIDPTPRAINAELSPDTQSSVLVGSRLFGAAGRLLCLDCDNGLKQIWTHEGPLFDNHVSLISCKDRLLAFGMTGEIQLIDGTSPDYKCLSKVTPIEDESGLYGHPALVGNRLYMRGTDAVHCFSLVS
jgi:outer membrane protein assembly factor BamB